MLFKSGSQAGKLSGADMVVYLLEKSRLTYQQPLERCYHAFYNLMSDEVKDLKVVVLSFPQLFWLRTDQKLNVLLPLGEVLPER